MKNNRPHINAKSSKKSNLSISLTIDIHSSTVHSRRVSDQTPVPSYSYIFISIYLKCGTIRRQIHMDLNVRILYYRMRQHDTRLRTS